MLCDSTICFVLELEVPKMALQTFVLEARRLRDSLNLKCTRACVGYNALTNWSALCEDKATETQARPQ